MSSLLLGVFVAVPPSVVLAAVEPGKDRDAHRHGADPRLLVAHPGPGDTARLEVGDPRPAVLVTGRRRARRGGGGGATDDRDT